jgi:glycosyltransferase involved in cell wall biosynthesis
MEKPLVTVGIPSYNHAKYLGRAVTSAVEQSYVNLEIIVVDNYSTDETDEVLASFHDPRISIIKVHNEGSIAASRNLVLNASQGEWIAFLDSDDWWTINKINRCAHYFSSDIDLIYHNLITVGENGKNSLKTNIRSRKLKKPVFRDLLIKGNTIATSSVVVRRSILTKTVGMKEEKEMIGIEDYNAWLRISQITDGFKHISENLGFYRIHNKNTSSSKNFLPPTNAYSEFLPLLSKKDIKLMENNYTYLTARLNYLSGEYVSNWKNLNIIIKDGTIFQRVKACYMLAMSYYKQKSGVA